MSEQAGVRRLAERLDGRRVLLTGVTGFVGEALLHRLLTDAARTRGRRPGPAQGRPAGATGSPAAAQADLRRPPSRRPAASTRAAGDRVAVRRGRPGRRPRAAGRPRRRRALRRRRVVRPADPGGVHRPTCSAPRPADAGARGGRPGTSTTSTSPRRTSPAAAAARCPKAPVDHDVDLARRARAGASRMAERIEDELARRPTAGESCARRPRRSTAAPGRSPPPRTPSERRAGRGSRSELVERRRASGPAAWAGPTCYTFTKAHGRAGRRGARRAAAPRARSCGRASSSPRWRRRTRAGSRASRWPSR